jgi:5-formyltetrahydrofolate cyclo-ligase
MADKESIRPEWLDRLEKKSDKPVPCWGKAAEILRKLQPYRDASTVFASPDTSLLQIRINCLVDGKDLVMPGPSLRNGFYLLKAHTIPFPELSIAATYKGLEKFGQLISNETIKKNSIDLLVADALTVDQQGTRLGDSKGFVDLSFGILSELGAIQPDAMILAVVTEEQITNDMLPREKWDVKMNGAVTPTGHVEFDIDQIDGKIYWEALPKERIKKISPLWKLAQKMKD